MHDPFDDEPRNAARRESETAVEPAVIAELRILDFFLAVAHPIPRIVALLAHDFLEPTADEEFHAVEAGLIHMAQHRMHHAGGHVVRPEAGVAVAQSRVDDANLVVHDDFLSHNGFNSP